MNIVFVINARETSDHVKKYELYKAAIGSGHTYTCIDMSCGKLLHEIYGDIAKAPKDLVITFDLAGLELRSELNTPSLNGLRCRVAHIIFNEAVLKKIDPEKDFMSLAHFFYLPESVDIGTFKIMHRNISNISLKPDDTELSIKNWFAEACDEMMLK